MKLFVKINKRAVGTTYEQYIGKKFLCVSDYIEHHQKYIRILNPYNNNKREVIERKYVNIPNSYWLEKKYKRVDRINLIGLIESYKKENKTLKQTIQHQKNSIENIVGSVGFYLNDCEEHPEKTKENLQHIKNIINKKYIQYNK